MCSLFDHLIADTLTTPIGRDPHGVAYTNGDDSTARSGWHRKIFARLLDRGSASYERTVAPYKRELFGALRGDVLEIGAGPGNNFQYFDPSVRLLVVEPNLHMRPFAESRAAALGRTVDWRVGTVERLPLPERSVDAVVSSLVLCSVDSLDVALAEIRRVLKPNGRFVFIEHVRDHSDEKNAKWQRRLRPLSRALADGCDPYRDTAAAIERAGFAHVTHTAFRADVPLTAPHIAGVATCAA